MITNGNDGVKPEIRGVFPGSIPKELKDIPRWIVWKSERAGVKWKKPPFSPRSGFKIHDKMPLEKQWGTFAQAMAALETGINIQGEHRTFDGIGIFPGPGLVGIDADKCVDVQNRITIPHIRAWVDGTQSYVELSPTITRDGHRGGIRAFILGEKPGELTKATWRGISHEMYAEGGNYLTVTGHRLNENSLADDRRSIDAFYRMIQKDPNPKEEPPPVFVTAADIPDERLLASMFRICGSEIESLYRTGTMGGDHSAEDYKLMEALAYFTGDRARAEAMFRASAMFRGDAKGKDYIAKSIEKIFTGKASFFDWNQGNGDQYDKRSAGAEGKEKTQSSEEQKTAGAESESWGEPIPLGRQRPPAMPEDIIPGPVGAMVKALSCFTETPYELAAGLCLPAVACAVAGKYEVQVKRGYSEPLNIMIVPALETGNRKSAVVEGMFGPHYIWEKAAAIEMKQEIDRVKTVNAAVEARSKKLYSEYAKAKDEDARRDLLIEIQETMDQKEPEIVSPRVIFDDITPEHMGTMAAMHDGRMALISDEGGIFDILAGRYSKNGAPNLDLFLKGYSGSPVRVDRGSRESVIIDKPAISLGISPQPETLVRLGAMPGFRARGVMARIGFLLPESLLGNRSLCGPEITENTISDYQRFIMGLLDIPICEDPQKLYLSNDAHAEWKAFSLHIEAGMRQGAKYETIKDWCGKLPGFAIRLCGLLHIMAEGGPEISLETMKKALELAAVFLDHALFAFDLIGEDESFDVARKVWAWVERTGRKEFSKRDCFQELKGRFRTMDEIEPGFKTLEEHNHIRVEKVSTGGRPSYICHVNPTVTGGGQ
ncbi:DUF3987 domain-containing protein [Desulfococcus sp.]|uniref:DUF3987 domain-containing protein n=1 Tax=Desulfococcus sp. TaxID=2025834 RepID=UPI0035947BD5